MSLKSKAIEIKLDYAEAWIQKGWALNKLSRYEEALEACNKAIEVKPDYAAEVRSVKDMIISNLSWHEKAHNYPEKALEIEPGFETPLQIKNNLLSRNKSGQDKSREPKGVFKLLKKFFIDF